MQLYEGKSARVASAKSDRSRGETAGAPDPNSTVLLFILATPTWRPPACSHVVHTPVHSLSACGFRLETGFASHKKKAELYFLFPLKKILTKNDSQAVPFFPSCRMRLEDFNSLGEVRFGRPKGGYGRPIFHFASRKIVREAANLFEIR